MVACLRAAWRPGLPTRRSSRSPGKKTAQNLEFLEENKQRRPWRQRDGDEKSELISSLSGCTWHISQCSILHRCTTVTAASAIAAAIAVAPALDVGSSARAIQRCQTAVERRPTNEKTLVVHIFNID